MTVSCATVPTVRITFSPSSITADAADTITLNVSGPYAFNVAATGATGASSVDGTVSAQTYTVTGSSGGSLVLTGTNSFCNGVSGTFTFSGTTPAPTPAPSDTASHSPVLETLTLAVSTGDTTCTGGSPTGYTGSWLQMPAADACSQSGPNANPNAKLLGWATDPIFPVAVAQQIVDLKYGPIDDYFYGMRMIFIPAGGWTYVSGSNTLYPIWAS